jgi:cyclic pyranopterin phosphate synthase
MKRIKEGKVEKGDVFQIAEVAGMQAVKKTPELIPHCHPIGIDEVKFEFEILPTEERAKQVLPKADKARADFAALRVKCGVKSTGKTGVEMEAITGVSVALLTIWDIVKKYEKDSEGQYPKTSIEGIRVLEKVKG